MDLMIEAVIYGITALFVMGTLVVYIRKGQKASDEVRAKVKTAKELGMHEPISLHPYINLSSCMGSGACIRACPEKDILGILDGKATIINATSCIGHGACFLACPTEAISLRIGTESRGVELPHVMPNYESNVSGIFIAGELGGMGLIKNATEQGIQSIEGITRFLLTLPKNDTDCDVLIVGSGPAGIAAALRAKEVGLTVRIVDQESLGGTVFTFPRQKVVMTKPMNIPGYGKVHLLNTSKKELLVIWEEALRRMQISVEEGKRIVGIAKEGSSFQSEVVGGERISSRSVLLAIGRRGTPRKLGVPGEELSKVTYKLIEPELYQGLDILVVGGGDSAVESALLLADDNRVSLSCRQVNLAHIKPGILTRIDSAIENGKITMLFQSQVLEISETEVKLSTNEGERFLANEQVFIFIGGELPNAFLKATGIEVTTHFGKTVKKHTK